MLEQNIEGGVAVAQPKAPELEGGDGNGKKSDSQILTDNRLGLYNEILNLKEKGFSDEYKKIGYKKFNQLLETNRDFRTDLLNDLNERGFNIAPENFQSAYVTPRKDEVYDFGAPAYTTTIKTDDIAAPAKKAPVEEPVGDGVFDQIKGLAKSAYNYGKDFYNIVKRDVYTGQAQRGAQVEDFLAGDVDTENLAKYLKKANDVGEIGIEAAYAKDESVAKDALDFMGMLGPAVVGSFASMTAAGWDKMAGITAAGAATGAVAGSTVLPGLGTGAGALAGAGRGAQAAMVQQGYNLEFTSSVIDDLTEKGAINPNADEATLKKQLDAAFANKDLMKPIYEKAHTRAGIIMGVDIAASGIGGKVIGTLRRAAMSKPVARTTVGKVLQESARQIAKTAPVRNAVRLAERASQVSERFAKSQIGKPIAKVASDVDATDIMAGAGGEALAQLKTEGEINWKEVVLEGGAEGSYIKALRALADIGNRKKELKALPPNAGPKGLLTTDKDEDIEYVTVTDEEFANYKKGNVDPQRAAGIIADVDIALQDPSHLERLKADGDNFYYEMVLDSFNKHIVAVENQKLYNVALSDIAELYGKTPDEVRAAITPNNPSFDEKISKDFSNSFNVLQQQYRDKAKNDSENAAGVSSEGGIGQESQQAQSQQGAGQEAAGDGGIFQEAEGEGRIAEIDDLLADDDNFFAQNNERLLSPEERADLEQERGTLVAPAAATAGEVAATEVATTTTPSGVASSEVATEQAPSSTPVVEETEVVSETVPAPEIGVQGIIRGYKNIAGDEGIGDVRDLLLNENSGTQVIQGMDDNWYAISFSKKGGDGQGIYEQGGSTPRPGHIITSVKISNPESKESIELAKQQSKEALDKILPTIKEGVIKETAVLSALKSSASTQTKKAPTTTTTTTTTKAEEKPAAKEIKPADVEIRKGKTHDKDGVYEAVYKGKVIGKMLFDKKEKVWVDAAGDKFAQKKDAVEKFVLRYNMVEANKPSTKPAKAETKTETKGEKKGEAKPETKAAMPKEVAEAYAKLEEAKSKYKKANDRFIDSEIGGPEFTTEQENALKNAKKELDKIQKQIADYEKANKVTEQGTKTGTKAETKTETKSETKAEPKKETKPQITKKDVSVKKGKDFATEGVYEVMANGEVIGRMYYDKSLYNAWVDSDVEPSTPSTFKGVLGTKPDAIDAFVNRYNATGAAKPTATKKAETKVETKTRTKGEATSTNQNDIAATAKALEGKDLTKISSFFADYFGIVEMFKDFKEAVGFNVRRAAKINLDESSANYGQLVDVNLVKKALKTIGINIEVVGKDKLANNNYAQARNGVIEVSETKIPLSVLLHEIGEAVLTELDKKGKIKHANNIFEAITTYGASRANDAFSDNFYLYFLSPSTLKDLSPNVYNELNAEIPSNLKSAVKELLKQNNVVEQTLKYKKGDTSFIAEAYYKAKEEGSNPELVKAVEELLGVKTETKPATPSAKVAPTFAEFDAISADRGKMKEAKAAFIEKHGQLAYDAMKEISANFTKITKALQEKEILTKKC